MALEVNSYRDLLEKLVGKTLTVINPECYQTTRLGHKLDTSFYNGRIVKVNDDHVVLNCEYAKDPKKEEVITVTQYLPLSHIKRVTVMPDEVLFHI